MMTRLPFAFLLCWVIQTAQAQCSIDLPNDTVTLYHGYDPLACTTLVPDVDGATPTQLVWSNGSTATSLYVCDTLSTWYQVSLTDDTLCTAMDSVYVNVVDVRCGNNLNKVAICHVPPGNPANAHTICISENAVPAHLAHGCHLGTCYLAPDTSASSELVMEVSPNPVSDQAWLTIASDTDQRVRVRVLDAMGRQLLLLSEATISANTPMTLLLDDRGIPNDLSLVWVEVRGERERIAQAVVLER
ncbi:MAG: hypothetical protein JNM62_08100 [Flavobacteriales bacterium]|nr:hypothetical protein [Flavobacteriales bacterium]